MRDRTILERDAALDREARLRVERDEALAVLREMRTRKFALEVLYDHYRAVSEDQVRGVLNAAATILDARGIMCVDTNRAGTAQTAPPRQQEVES